MQKLVVLYLLYFSINSSLNGQGSLDDIIDRYENFEESLNSSNSTGWSNNGPDKIIKKQNKYGTLFNQLELVNKEQLSDQDLINFEMLHYILSNEVFLLDFKSYLMPLNSEGGFITSMIYQSQNVDLNSEQAVNDYLKKLTDTKRFLLQQQKHLSQGIEEGKVRPKLVVENCLAIIGELIHDGPDDFFLLQPLLKKNIIIENTLKQDVFLSFKELYRFLNDDYLPNANVALGISKINNGNKFYAQRIRYNTSLNLTPEDIYNIGLSEVARIKAEMENLIVEIGFDGSLPEFIADLRDDQRFIAKTPEELLYYASWLSKKAEEILPRYFGKLPRLPFTVNPVPEDIAANYTAGRYSGGSMSSKHSGQYLVNTYKLESRPMYMLPALTLHEAVPGHHLQGSLAKELEGLPAFRSQYLSAFGEGWGLYAEYLGKEAGMYKTAYEEFGRLSYEMWRACRLVIDPGIHAKGWTRDQAIQYMRDHTSLSFYEIETEINRYIGWPGQAVSYKIGEMKIRELRIKAENELGDKFEIRDFHDLVLANGSIPLNTLERLVNGFINKRR